MPQAVPLAAIGIVVILALGRPALAQPVRISEITGNVAVVDQDVIIEDTTDGVVQITADATIDVAGGSITVSSRIDTLPVAGADGQDGYRDEAGMAHAATNGLAGSLGRSLTLVTRASNARAAGNITINGVIYVRGGDGGKGGAGLGSNPPTCESAVLFGGDGGVPGNGGGFTARSAANIYVNSTIDTSGGKGGQGGKGGDGGIDPKGPPGPPQQGCPDSRDYAHPGGWGWTGGTAGSIQLVHWGATSSKVIQVAAGVHLTAFGGAGGAGGEGGHGKGTYVGDGTRGGIGGAGGRGGIGGGGALISINGLQVLISGATLESTGGDMATPGAGGYSAIGGCFGGTPDWYCESDVGGAAGYSVGTALAGQVTIQASGPVQITNGTTIDVSSRNNPATAPGGKGGKDNAFCAGAPEICYNGAPGAWGLASNTGGTIFIRGAITTVTGSRLAVDGGNGGTGGNGGDAGCDTGNPAPTGGGGLGGGAGTGAGMITFGSTKVLTLTGTKFGRPDPNDPNRNWMRGGNGGGGGNGGYPSGHGGPGAPGGTPGSIIFNGFVSRVGYVAPQPITGQYGPNGLDGAPPPP